jgi:hypothetical protein
MVEPFSETHWPAMMKLNQLNELSESSFKDQSPTEGGYQATSAVENSRGDVSLIENTIKLSAIEIEIGLYR